MFPATYNGQRRDWEEALSMLVDCRQELLRTVLPLDRDAWRVRPEHGKWCVAQIVEHLNDTDRAWWRMLQVSEFFCSVLPPRKRGLTSTIENPFGVKPYKTSRFVSNPKGNARRASMVAEYEKAMRSLEHHISFLSHTKRAKIRLFSPMAGVIGITDAILLLHYHDLNHLNQIQRAITALRDKGVTLYPTKVVEAEGE